MIRLVDPLDRPGRAREFRCTVHGLCFENRYRLLDRLHAGDPLELEREPENAIGEDAIRVEAAETGILGYLPREISHWLAPVMDAGREAQASVLKVRSGCPYYERLVIEVNVR